MNSIQCSGDWLVEYADGDLAAEELPAAEAHLAACPGCSRELAALRQGREMLETYFQMAGRAIPAARVSGAGSLPPWQAAALALAATAAAAILVVTLALQTGRRENSLKTEPAAPALKVETPSSPAPAADVDDVLAQIRRETQIARLRAASEILAKEPGMMERHLALEKYLADAYGVTAVASKSEM